MGACTAPWPARFLGILALLLALLLPGASCAAAADASGSYLWQPVRIGAGGYVTGFAVSPQDANARFCRTDVGNAYRWDAAAGEWKPMIVRRPDGSGMPAATAVTPAESGCTSVMVDPKHSNVVYVACPFNRSADVSGIASSLNLNIYKSVDGGVNFTGANLNLACSPNGPWRMYGERLAVDPNDSQVVYFGSDSSGLYRSTDGGATFAAVGGSAPGASANVITCLIAGGSTTSAFGQTVSAVIYAVVGDGGVYRSTDGGQSWSDIAAGTALAGHGGQSTLDQNGTLWVCQNGTSTLWKWSSGRWSSVTVSLYSGLSGVAVDPGDANRLFASGGDMEVSRSLDGGATWTNLVMLPWANTFGWLPQTITPWRSNGGIRFAPDRSVWLPQGNEGVLTFTPSLDNHETPSSPPKWTISSRGIEEIVTRDVIIPKGSGDHALVAGGDVTGMRINDPDQFTATQIPLADQILCCANGLAWCPNASGYVAISASDYFATGTHANYSGYSSDGGVTWHLFASRPIQLQSGSIAVSRRGAWSLGSDHLVILPNGNYPPYYSKDGGNSWTATTSFPTKADGTLNGPLALYTFALAQRQLKADPFVADRYYLNVESDGFYISSDGGVTWARQASAGLAAWAHHGQLEVNQNLQNDLWFVDGQAGALSHGLWHSTNGGVTFSKLAGIDYGITLALGAGSGVAGDASYTVYFYGKLTGDANWGVFRSTTAGASWDRISYYPCGILDQPSCLAASWDTYGLVYLGFNGNSFVYGKLGGTVAPGTAPTITSTAPTTATVGAAYSYTVTATGSPAPTFSLTTKPTGMTINATTGAISWTPSSTGSFSVTVTATNGVNPAATQSFTIVVAAAPAPPAITSTAKTTATVGVAYSYTVTATGSPTPTFSLTTKPTGMTINATTGAISWAPSSAGSFSVTVTATNGVNPAATQSFTIVVSAAGAAPVITSTAPTTATVGVAYHYTVTATGSPTPTFGLSTFPAGMTINAVTGAISWTPVNPGSVTIAITASNDVNPAATQYVTISVAPASTPSVGVSSATTDGGHSRCGMGSGGLALLTMIGLLSRRLPPRVRVERG